jgi:ankyrin repeat protein
MSVLIVFDIVMNKGWTSTVKYLLEKGADINAQTISGRTPLMYAVQLLHENLVIMLTNRKDIHLEESDLEGYTALIIAVELGEPGRENAMRNLMPEK